MFYDLLINASIVTIVLVAAFCFVAFLIVCKYTIKCSDTKPVDGYDKQASQFDIKPVTQWDGKQAKLKADLQARLALRGYKGNRHLFYK